MKFLRIVLLTCIAATTYCADKPAPINYDLLYIDYLNTGQLKEAEELLQTHKVTADCSALLLFSYIAGVGPLLRKYGAFNDCKAGHLQQIAFFLHNNVLHLPEQRTTALDIAQEILEHDICIHPMYSKSGELLVDELSNDDPDEHRLKELLIAAQERSNEAEAQRDVHLRHYWCP